MRHLLTATLTTTMLASVLSMPAAAQKLNLDFSALAAKATEKNEITLDGDTLRTFQQAAADKKDQKGGSDAAAKLFGELQGVAVRNYKFAATGAYSDRDLEPLHQQVGSASGWTRIVNVKDKDESTEIYVYNQGGKTAGMLVIAAEPKELSVVHISGAVQLAQLQDIVKSTIQYDLSAATAGAKQ
jgi:hypothetical protein